MSIQLLTKRNENKSGKSESKFRADLFSKQMLIRNIIFMLILLFFYTPTSLAKNPLLPKIKYITSFEDSKDRGFLKDPISLSVDDSNGDLIIANTGKSEVLILDSMGNPRGNIGSGDSAIDPYGVAVDQKGRIFVSELTGSYIKTFNPMGSLISTINLQGEDGSGIRPGRMSIGSKDNLYIVDRQNQHVYVIDEKGNSLLIVKTKKDKKQQMLQDVAFDENGNIYCLNSLGPVVNVFDRKGQYTNSFGSHSSADDGFSFPTSISLDKKGRIWIVDSFQHKIKVFDSKGNFLLQFGGIGTKSEKFFFPIDIVFGKEGKLYVLEKGANRIQVFQVEDLK